MLAQEIHSNLNMQLGGGASAEIHAGTTMDLSKMQRNDLGPEEYAKYKAKVLETSSLSFYANPVGSLAEEPDSVLKGTLRWS